MKKFLFFITLFGFVMAATPGFAQKKAKKKKKKGKKEKVAEPIVLETAADTISYAFGLVLGNNLYTEEVFDIDLDVLSEGIKEAQKGKAEIFSQEDARDMVNKHIETKRKERAERAKKEGIDFLAENALKEGMQVTDSGLQYEILRAGTGEIPTKASKVVTHYKGSLINGTVFDSSYDRGEPLEFSVGGVIKGWTEALQLMPVGSKWKLYIPSELAYGERGAGGQIPPHAALIFEIELLDIK